MTSEVDPRTEIIKNKGYKSRRHMAFQMKWELRHLFLFQMKNALMCMVVAKVFRRCESQYV